MRPLAIAALALLAGGIGDRFIYFPSKHPAGDWNPDRRGLAVEDRSIRAADGTRLHAWWAARPGARATILLLHGNAGNVTQCTGHMLRFTTKLDAQVLALDYRGYGKSEGSPSEEGLYKDAEAAFDELTGPLGVAPGTIVLYGHSLGTGVATELALRRPAAGVVLEAPFTSMPEMVRRTVPFLDPQDLVSQKYDNLGKAPRLAVPLLVVHGTRDRTIPIEMGRAVFDAAPEPKSFLAVEGAGHIDAFMRGGDEVLEAMRALIERAVGGKRRAAPAPELF